MTPRTRALPTTSPSDTASDAPDARWVAIVPWVDPPGGPAGFDPRSAYVEEFWLGTLGPTALLLLRRLVAAFEQYPDGYELDLDVTAAALGLGHRRGNASPFRRAFHRCVMFGLAQQLAGDGYQVRRRVPELPHRHLVRLPPSIQADHARWVGTSPPDQPGTTGTPVRRDSSAAIASSSAARPSSPFTDGDEPARTAATKSSHWSR